MSAIRVAAGSDQASSWWLGAVLGVTGLASGYVLRRRAPHARVIAVGWGIAAVAYGTWELWSIWAPAVESFVSGKPSDVASRADSYLPAALLLAGGEVFFSLVRLPRDAMLAVTALAVSTATAASLVAGAQMRHWTGAASLRVLYVVYPMFAFLILVAVTIGVGLRLELRGRRRAFAGSVGIALFLGLVASVGYLIATPCSNC